MKGQGELDAGLAKDCHTEKVKAQGVGWKSRETGPTGLAWGSPVGICSLPSVFVLSKASQNHWFTKITPVGSEAEAYTG